MEGLPIKKPLLYYVSSHFKIHRCGHILITVQHHDTTNHGQAKDSWHSYSLHFVRVVYITVYFSYCKRVFCIFTTLEPAYILTLDPQEIQYE
jgi:hypothetical protein